MTCDLVAYSVVASASAYTRTLAYPHAHMPTSPRQAYPTPSLRLAQHHSLHTALPVIVMMCVVIGIYAHDSMRTDTIQARGYKYMHIQIYAHPHGNMHGSTHVDISTNNFQLAGTPSTLVYSPPIPCDRLYIATSPICSHESYI